MEKPKVIHSSFWSNIFHSPADKSDLRKSLLSSPIFSALSNKDISLLINITHNRTYLPGEYIFYQGDPGIGLYIILEGEVEIQRTTDENETVTLANFSVGDFFGELALIDSEKRSASAVAKTDCRLSVIFKPDLDEFIEAYPKKGNKILRGMSNIIAVRLRKVNEDYFTHTVKNKLPREGEHGT